MPLGLGINEPTLLCPGKCERVKIRVRFMTKVEPSTALPWLQASVSSRIGRSYHRLIRDQCVRTSGERGWHSSGVQIRALFILWLSQQLGWHLHKHDPGKQVFAF